MQIKNLLTQMIKKIYLLLVITISVGFSTASSAQINLEKEQAIKGFLQRIFDDNSASVKKEADQNMKDIKNGQTPGATVVMCSDSRVQATEIHSDAINNLFFIRNIGNQIETAKGSIEYGVRHLHTPVLLIVGHVGCGAVEAALSDYSNESDAIRRELSSIKLSKSVDPRQGVIDNINNQVGFALNEFSKEFKDGNLLIIGAVYDFKNKYGFGYNKLIILNVNGDTNPDKIRLNRYFEGVGPFQIGVKKST